MTMTNHLFDALFSARLADERTFLHLEGGAVLSYQKFLQQSARLAHVLSSAGVEPGDRVAVQVEKSAEALALYVAAVRAGAVFLPLNTAYMPAEFAYFVEDAKPKLVVCGDAARANLQPIAEAAGAGLMTLNGDGSGTLMDAAADMQNNFLAAARRADDLAAILYTSGTTGRSKGAMLSHDNLLSNAETLVDYWRFSEEDVLLHALPIFHTHGLFVATNVIAACGGSMIFQPGFKVDAVLDALPRASVMMGVPTFYTRLLADQRFTGDLVAHMRLFVSGSAPLLADTHVEFEARTGHRILERYGMTETNMNTSNPYEGARRAGTVGFALPGISVRVTDPESGNELPSGEIGVLEIKGPNVFQGYWQMPEKTAAEFRGDWFISGDLGFVDQDGYITIVGRGKDLIISGGYNIYPKEVELAVDAVPGVVESAVIGVPHADFGESVVAVVVRSGTVDEAAIMAVIGPSMARFKQPKKIVFVDELPRNTMGKVQKNVLRDTYGDLLG